MSAFHTGEVLPEDAEGADGSQKQGRSIWSCFVWALAIVNLTSCVLNGISSTSRISIFHLLTSSFSLCSRTQTGGKLAFPSKRVPPREELKLTDRWAVSHVHDLHSELCICSICVSLFSMLRQCTYQISRAYQSTVCVFLWTMWVSCDACKAITTQRPASRRRLNRETNGGVI